MLEYSADGYHYFPESKAPLKMKNKECEFHGFQPRVPLKKKKIRIWKWYSKLLWHVYSWKTFIAKIFEKKYIKIKPEKREQKKKLSKEQN